MINDDVIFSITAYACSEILSGQEVDVGSTGIGILLYQLGNFFVCFFSYRNNAFFFCLIKIVCLDKISM
jgi:hypothetical protein